MDIDLLKTFLEVSRTLHFSRAAESLYLTQSTISFRIRQLENQLGVTLFARHRNNINLTHAGQKFLPFARHILTTWQEACQQVLQKEYTKISIGASSALWETTLPCWVQQIFQLSPTLEIITKIANSTLLLEQIYQHKIDLLFTTENYTADELKSLKVATLKLSKFSSHKEGSNNKAPYIHITWRHDLFQAEKSASLLTTSSAQLARQLLKTIDGYAFLPIEWCDNSEEIEIDKHDQPVIECPVHAVWSKSSEQQNLIELLLKQISELLISS